MADLVINKEIVTDTWTRVADDAPLPAGDVIVSRARWLEERESLLAREGKVGALFASTENPVDDLIEGLALIALDFPVFKDGRAYSYARQLRQRVDFKGQIRAVGVVLHDQLRYMWRCGYDAFELSEGLDAQKALEAFDDFTVDYQKTTPNAL